MAGYLFIFRSKSLA